MRAIAKQKRGREREKKYERNREENGENRGETRARKTCDESATLRRGAERNGDSSSHTAQRALPRINADERSLFASSIIEKRLVARDYRENSFNPNDFRREQCYIGIAWK